jgi:O-antigen ligase
MRGIVNILPWIASLLMAFGIVAMQAIGGGGRPMFPLMVCYLPILAAGILSIPTILLGISRRAPDWIAFGSTILLGVYLLIRSSIGGDPGLRDFELLRLASCFLIYLITVAVVTTKGPRLLFLWILLAAAFLQTCFEVYQFYCDQAWVPMLECLPFLKTYYSETVGTYANKNHLAWLLGDGALFALALSCWGRFRWVTRGLLLYLFLFLGLGVCISLSRGGVVALITGLVILALASLLLLLMADDRGTLLSGILAIVFIAAVTGGAFVFLSTNPSLGLRMQGLWMDDYREDLWRASIHDLGKAPFFGMGAGSFQWCARLMMPAESLLAHNDYAQILSEYGLAGFLILILFLAAHLRSVFSSLFRHRGEDSGIGSSSDAKAILLGASAVVAAQLVHSGFDFNMHLASNALLSAFCLGILGGDGLHGGHRPLSLATRGFETSLLMGFLALVSSALLKNWSPELQFFRLEQTFSSARSSEVQSLVPAAVDANRLLAEIPENTRYADLRVALYRTMLSRSEAGFREPNDRLEISRQLDCTLVTNSGDWYLWMNQSFLLGYLGDQEGSRAAFLQAMIRMPLFALSYGDHAAVLESQGETEIALHYALIASRFKDAQGLEPLTRRLQEKRAKEVLP